MIRLERSAGSARRRTHPSTDLLELLISENTDY
jgi:hypothetical protein